MTEVRTSLELLGERKETLDDMSAVHMFLVVEGKPQPQCCLPCSSELRDYNFMLQNRTLKESVE